MSAEVLLASTGPVLLVSVLKITRIKIHWHATVIFSLLSSDVSLTPLAEPAVAFAASFR